MDKKGQGLELIILLIFVISCAALIISLLDTPTTEILDRVCNNNNDVLVRINGAWVCSTDYYLREDFRFPVEVIRQGAATEQPTFTAFVGDTQVLAFSPTQLQEGFLSIQMPHSRLDNTLLKPHFHWSPSNTNTGAVVWCLEYTCANINAAFTLSDIKCTIDAGDGQTNKHQMTEMINISNSLEASAMCMIRIFRNATDTRDTYNANALLLEFDIHYTAQSIGELFPTID